MVLFNWQQTWKPPLLGPQMSVIPFNQSAIYFYLLFPIFVASSHSLLSSTITILIFYLVLFWLGVFLFRHRPLFLRSLLFVAFFIIIHPQFITQQRFVWNPSFVAACITVALYMLLLIRERYTQLRALALTFSLALAIGFSFSALPVALVIFLSGLILAKTKRWQLLIMAVVSGILVYLPNIVFEIRHNFVLIKAIWDNGMLSQGDQSLVAKSQDLLTTLLPATSTWLTQASPYLYCLLVATGLLQVYRALVSKAPPTQRQYLIILVIVLLTSTIIQLLSPVGVANHYIFPILTVGIVLLSFFELRFHILILIAGFLIFTKTEFISEYLSTPEVSVTVKQACAEIICQHETQPVMVSEQSSRHPYHSAWAYQYLLAEAGCQVVPVEPNSTRANKMVVILDNTTYEHGRTAYNELTQLGESRVEGDYDCPAPLKVVVLNKE